MESALVIIGAVVVGGLISLVTQWLILWRSERLERAKWQQEEAREGRQRVREVRSEPLLAFRHELAQMAQKYTALIKAAQMQHTRSGISAEEAAEIFRDVGNDWNSYVASGDYERALFELADHDIIDAAQHLWQQLAGAYVETTDAPRSVFKELEEIRASIAEVQKLISQRLQEL